MAEKFAIEYLQVICGSNVFPIADVVLTSKSGTKRGYGQGNGPIDSLFKAIQQAIQSEDFFSKLKIRSVSKTTESIGVATVKLRKNFFRRAKGVGEDKDIITAAAKAYINALNKL